jgi:hypothetical protein
MTIEVTIIGKVKETNDDRRSPGVSIISDDGIFDVKMNAEGKNLLYEIGNKVEVTGKVTATTGGIHKISVMGYEVYELEEDDPDYCEN